MKTLFIEPHSPLENGYSDCFNGKLRDEVLSQKISFNLNKEKVLIENWRKYYNTIRPQSSLNGLLPAREAILSFSIQTPQLLRNTDESGSTLT